MDAVESERHRLLVRPFVLSAYNIKKERKTADGAGEYGEQKEGEAEENGGRACARYEIRAAS